MKVVWDGKSTGTFGDFDCYIAEALLRKGRAIKTEKETLQKYKVQNLIALAEKQQEKLAKYPKLQTLFSTIEMPLTSILWEMEQEGILLDTQMLTKIGKDIDTQVSILQTEIAKETGDSINLNSPSQLGEFLATKMQVPLGKTKTGKYATNANELIKFKKQFPLIDQLLTYRELTKLRSTYVESLIQKVDKNSRIHTTYHQVYVNTGRLASSNPNLQNIPVTSDIGQQIKSCFMAPSGQMLVSFDYSQQELRILAHLTGEKALIDAFENKQDVHTLTASKLFHIPYEEVSKPQRNIGKTINFGIIYGMSSYGLSAGMDIPQEEAELFIQQFYASYPKIKTYYDTYLKNAKTDGVVETMLGRRRYVFEYPGQKFIDNSMRRVLMNYPIQGTAADLMKKAMVDVDEKILKNYPDVKLLLQIHDDLVFLMPDTDDSTKIIKEIRETLCSVYPLSVPLTVEIKTGTRWGDLKPHA